jgi:hypothetical protein
MNESKRQLHLRSVPDDEHSSKNQKQRLRTIPLGERNPTDFSHSNHEHSSTFASFHNDEGDDDVDVLQTGRMGKHGGEDGGSVEEAEFSGGSIVFNDSHTSFVIEDGVQLPGMHPTNGGSRGASSSGSTTTRSSEEFSRSADRRRAMQKKRELTVGQKETLALRRIRVLLFAVTLFIAIAGAIGMYMITQQENMVTFESSFVAQGAMVLQHFETHVLQELQALDTLSNDITALVEDRKLTWPFVTIPESAPILERYLQLLNAAIVAIFPIVPAHLRSQWEQYSVKEQGWM